MILISINIWSISSGSISSFNNFAVILFMKCTKTLPPWAFPSRRQGLENSLTLNCKNGNDSANYVFEIIRMSMLEVTSDTNASNLFRIELIFIWVIIKFSGYFKSNVFKPSIISCLFSAVFSEERTSNIFSFWFWVSTWS